MKYPLWILNSSLLFFTLLVLLFAVVSRQHVPTRDSIIPEETTPFFDQESLKINIAKIYENDLFGTYVKEMPVSDEDKKVGVTLPAPPRPKAPVTPEIPRPQFLDPLNITLKGIIVFVHDSSKNRAIIENNQTKQEASYQLGDQLEDAQLIRILSNKIIFLRSNGQQEVLYLKERDAQEDPAYASINAWSEVVKETALNTYSINKHMFTERVENLGHFIDLLSITSVYKKGTSIGCRIGQLGADSLGKALGFELGDLVVSVNDIPATSTENRLVIYKDIMANNENKEITVELLRSNRPATLHYSLSNDLKVTTAQNNTKYPFLKDQPIKIAYTTPHNQALEDLRTRERKNMLQMSAKTREEIL